MYSSAVPFAKETVVDVLICQCSCIVRSQPAAELQLPSATDQGLCTKLSDLIYRVRHTRP